MKSTKHALHYHLNQVSIGWVGGDNFLSIFFSYVFLNFDMNQQILKLICLSFILEGLRWLVS